MGKLADELKTYNQTVLDHFQNPRNLGDLKDATCTVMAENPACQDIVKLSVRVERDAIRDVRVKIMGCTVAIASASMLGELIRGQSLADARKLDQAGLVRALGGLPESKIRCTTAALQALEILLKRMASDLGPKA